MVTVGFTTVVVTVGPGLDEVPVLLGFVGSVVVVTIVTVVVVVVVVVVVGLGIVGDLDVPTTLELDLLRVGLELGCPDSLGGLPSLDAARSKV